MYLALVIGVTYKTAWLMLHKIRIAMGQRDARYQLAGLVEFDDAYFGAPPRAASAVGEPNKQKFWSACGSAHKGHLLYAKMEVIPVIKG